MNENQDGQRGQVPNGDPLKRAAACAKAGDPVGMITALAEQRALDGFQRAFAHRYSKLPDTAIEEAIAGALDKAYAEIQGGKKITSLGSWLWKVIENDLNDAWITEYKNREVYDETKHSDLVEGGATDGPKEQDVGIDRERLRVEAVRLAREMIPTLGQANLVRVMTVLVDAIEAGIDDLPHATIAEALDLRPDTVRVLVFRGLERMARAAEARGLHLDRARLKELFPGIGDVEDDNMKMD